MCSNFIDSPAAALCTVACQASLSVGFSRHEYWSGLPCTPPGDLPDSGIEPMPPASPALAGGFFTTEPPKQPMKPPACYLMILLALRVYCILY